MKFRYFVVEDAYFIQELISGILDEINGVSVGTADDGESAIFSIQRTLPDLVVLDMVLPKKNGIQVAEKIKSIHPSCRILAVSTLDDLHFIDKAKAAGCDFYLIKPFTRKQLQDAVAFVMEKQKGVVNE